MALFKIKKGLNIPINGEPKSEIIEKKDVSKVAILGDDYVLMKPSFKVKEGDKVKKGEVLFVCRKKEEIKFVSPVSGVVESINRGEKRRFLSIVIKREGNEEVDFKSFNKTELKSIKKDDVIQQLLDSGLWVSIRRRPFGKIALPDEEPFSIFINSMDTNPLAPDMSLIVRDKIDEINAGIFVLSKLTKGKLFLIKSPELDINIDKFEKLEIHEFKGPHPAGNVGTHIHFLDPVEKNKFVWYLNISDLIKIGHLFLTGKLDNEKIISLAGPMVKEPVHVKTIDGACIDEVVGDNLKSNDDIRIISGSVLNGRTSKDPENYLGKYHNQISVLKEGYEREFMGWAGPGFKRYSFLPVFMSYIFRKKKYDFTTALNGGQRAIVPIGVYEKVMPLDILPTFLLRALSVNDIEDIEKLGGLELEEEDLALCTFVSPSKIDYGKLLRENLNIIEKEG